MDAVLFDWDGTLVDSATTTYECYREVLARFGIAFDRDSFRDTYSPDWYRTYRAVGLPEARWPEADELWLAGYRQRETPLISGARAALGRLTSAGFRLGLVTSGDRSRVARELEGHGLRDLFAVVLCAEDLPRRKPAPDGLIAALALLDVPPSDTAYVGDSPEDIEMARGTGAFSVGIPGGFPNEDALRASAPDLWAASLDEAVTALCARR